jgi:hypothetical protein
LNARHPLLRCCQYQSLLELTGMRAALMGGGVQSKALNIDRASLRAETRTSRRNRRLVLARSVNDDFDTPVLRLTHTRARGHQQIGIAETLDSDRTLRHAVLDKFAGDRPGPTHG